MEFTNLINVPYVQQTIELRLGEAEAARAEAAGNQKRCNAVKERSTIKEQGYLVRFQRGKLK